jgi:hypothetical protein
MTSCSWVIDRRAAAPVPRHSNDRTITERAKAPGGAETLSKFAGIFA